MKIVVTGSNGQLGQEIRSVSNNLNGADFIFTDVDQLDITNENSVKEFFALHQPDFLINCAAYTAVDQAEKDVEICYKVNALAPGILASACKQYDVKIIHVSTDYVFDGTNYRPYLEADAPNPQSEYGRSKLKGEELIQNQDIDYVILRTSWLYSSYGNNFVKTMLSLGESRQELRVISDQIGTPTYAGDLALSIIDIIRYIQTQKKCISGVYHYSNEGVASWYDFTETIFRLAQDITCDVYPISSEEYPTLATRPFYSVLSKDKIKQVYGIKGKHWTKSLQTCITKLKIETIT